MAAGIIEAGLDGIANRRDPGPPLSVNAYTEAAQCEHLRKLPDNLLDALRSLEQDTVLTAGLGKAFTRSFLKLKNAQWREYARHVSPWELEHTLDC